MSLLSGFDAIVDRHLGIEAIGCPPHYRHLTAYRHVAALTEIDGDRLVDEAFSRIEQNWPGCACRSAENWRWGKKLDISSRNSSPEKRFEKALAASCPEWINMIPVASGVMPAGVEEAGRRIDLVRCVAPRCYEFVELKIGDRCDTPLYAAIEILSYGLIYVFSRVHVRELGYHEANELLSAISISLKALLPHASYRHGSLVTLERALNQGLAALTRRLRLGCTLDLSFECFPSGSLNLPAAEAMLRRERIGSNVVASKAAAGLQNTCSSGD